MAAGDLTEHNIKNFEDRIKALEDEMNGMQEMLIAARLELVEKAEEEKNAIRWHNYMCASLSKTKDPLKAASMADVSVELFYKRVFGRNPS